MTCMTSLRFCTLESHTLVQLFSSKGVADDAQWVSIITKQHLLLHSKTQSLNSCRLVGANHRVKGRGVLLVMVIWWTSSPLTCPQASVLSDGLVGLLISHSLTHTFIHSLLPYILVTSENKKVLTATPVWRNVSQSDSLKLVLEVMTPQLNSLCQTRGEKVSGEQSEVGRSSKWARRTVSGWRIECTQAWKCNTRGSRRVCRRRRPREVNERTS